MSGSLPAGMYRLRSRTILLIGFFVISAIFIFLRIKTLNHILMWDEAWHILSLRAFSAGAIQDPFYRYYFFHPPFYTSIAQLLAPFRAGIDLRMELVSFSV